jgi:hypothetical protein
VTLLHESWLQMLGHGQGQGTTIAPESPSGEATSDTTLALPLPLQQQTQLQLLQDTLRAQKVSIGYLHKAVLTLGGRCRQLAMLAKRAAYLPAASSGSVTVTQPLQQPSQLSEQDREQLSELRRLLSVEHSRNIALQMQVSDTLSLLGSSTEQAERQRQQMQRELAEAQLLACEGVTAQNELGKVRRSAAAAAAAAATAPATCQVCQLRVEQFLNDKATARRAQVQAAQSRGLRGQQERIIRSCQQTAVLLLLWGAVLWALALHNWAAARPGDCPPPLD